MLRLEVTASADWLFSADRPPRPLTIPLSPAPPPPPPAPIRLQRPAACQLTYLPAVRQPGRLPCGQPRSAQLDMCEAHLR